MMKKLALTTALALTVSPVLAHNYLTLLEAPAGYVHDIGMRVPHGCKDSPVNQVRIKIPEGMLRVTVEYRDDWDIEIKNRKIDPPIKVEGGMREISETVDEIIWSNPKNILPPDRVGEFRFRGMLPNEPGRILFFRTLNDCVEGDDYYVDLPPEPLNLDDPDFHKKFWAFMIATATPAPYLILVEPERPQYPWEWESLEDRRPGHAAD
jgi:uncharacterized protein YcnI